MNESKLCLCPWRVGRKLGRTIYAMVGREPSDDDVLLGMVDARSVAEHIVELHNAEILRMGRAQ